MGFIGSLIDAGVKAVGGGLKGQNAGDDELYRRHEQEKKDRREEDHYQSGYLLRKYALERQTAAEGRREAFEERERAHMDAQDRPEWQRQGYPSLEAWEKHERQPYADHTDRRPNWQKEGYPSFELWRRDQTTAKTGTGGAEGIRNLNSVIDDEDRVVGRLERETPKPWDAGMVADSAGYTESRNRAVAATDSARARRDRFSAERNNLVAQQFGVDQPKPPAAAAAGPGAVDPASLSRGAGHSPRARAPGAQMSARMQEINRQYQEAVQWRGPNGERKDPAALQQRYLEAMKSAGGQ